MDRRLGGPLPLQPANPTRAHPVPPEFFTLLHAKLCAYAVLAPISKCYPPVQGRLPTRYSPVRHSVTVFFIRRIKRKRFVRLACVRHAASVHPEPGSNSQIKCFPVQPCGRCAKMSCASSLASRPFRQMPYGAQPHRDEGCSASEIEMHAEQA